jgi:hypothetical protein
MADQTTPDTTNQQWSFHPPTISQAPFLQSWNGIPAPFANQQDQIQQSLQISGVYPGQMPPNAFLGNTPARYAFGRTVPGTSPYVGALLDYMQGSKMPPTGVNMSTLGLQNGTGQVPPPSGPGPYGTPYGPGTFPAPGQGFLGGGNVSPPGQPAPPFPPMSDPRQAGGTFGQPTGPGGPMPPVPPGAGQSNRGAFNTGMWNGTGGLSGGNTAGLLGHSQYAGMTPQQVKATQLSQQQAAMKYMPSDPAGKVMWSIVNREPWTATGLTSDQYQGAYYNLPADWNRSQYKAPR